MVGHIDNTGAEDMNVSLSQARAASVVKALSQMGIAPARLAAHGAGPYAPVAANKTDDLALPRHHGVGLQTARAQFERHTAQRA